jgi:hypothetical protein
MRKRADALVVGTDSLFFNRRLQLATLATRHASRRGVPVTSVTPAEIAGPAYYPYERCKRWSGGLQATGRTMLGACERILRAYRGRST